MPAPAPESRDLDPAERARTGARFIRLSDGFTRFRLSDPMADSLLVLVHGYSVGSFVWQPLEARLNAAGVATLSFDLYGHGFSDRPACRYDRALFARQLDELLRAVAPTPRLRLLGWSMGAMVATACATDTDHRIEAMLLLSPSGLPIRLGALGRVALVPGLGDLGFRLIGGAGLRAAQRNFFEDTAHLPDFLAGYDAQCAYRGFARAMLSALRGMNMDDFAEGYARLGASGIPVDVLWAEKDRATPFANSQRFRRLVPQARLTPLADVGHASQFEQPDRIAAHVLDWLRRQPKTE